MPQIKDNLLYYERQPENPTPGDVWLNTNTKKANVQRRNNMAQAYKHTFTTTGKTPFPIEMLTYDQCFPHTKQDAITIYKKKEMPAEYERDLLGLVPGTFPLLEEKTPPEESSTIELTTINTDPNWQPSIAHWNKHGW